MARVLHIEDDPRNRRLVSKLLSVAGHEVIDAETGLEGIRLANEHRPDLILVDINVPDLDGYEVTLRLRSISSLAGVPIVAITAEGDRETSLAVGADGFISKPIDASRFERTVRRFLRGHREKREPSQTGPLRARSQKIVERLERKVVELSEANRSLEEMARLRREFLQNVSHELATPMTPVVGYLRLLLDESLGPLTPLQKKCLLSVQGSTQRLRSLVDTLLDVSSLETGRMHFYHRDYDVLEVVKGAVTEVAPRLAKEGVSLLEEPIPASMPAKGDPEKLRRALVLVLENAAKFTPRGGQVAVGLRRGVEGETREAWYQIVVADSGPGIAPEHQDKILQPFYQADGSVTRAHGGLGLGLAFVRRVSESMGGGIEVSSPPDEDVAGERFGGTLVRLKIQASAPNQMKA